MRTALLFFFLVTSSYAHGSASPISVNLIPPFELPPDQFTIGGLRISILYGSQKSVYGLDLGGLGNVTYAGFGGIALAGVFNVTHGNTYIFGLQAAGLSNINTNNTKIIGLQAAGLFNSNSFSSDIFGLQVAPLNIGLRTRIIGAQVGLYNAAGIVYGFQIGILNTAVALHGIQIGLMNFNASGPIHVFPIINIGI